MEKSPLLMAAIIVFRKSSESVAIVVQKAFSTIISIEFIWLSGNAKCDSVLSKPLSSGAVKNFRL